MQGRAGSELPGLSAVRTTMHTNAKCQWGGKGSQARRARFGNPADTVHGQREASAAETVYAPTIMCAPPFACSLLGRLLTQPSSSRWVCLSSVWQHFDDSVINVQTHCAPPYYRKHTLKGFLHPVYQQHQWGRPGSASHHPLLHLQVGQMSEPIKTQFGYHLILCEGRKA